MKKYLIVETKSVFQSGIGLMNNSGLLGLELALEIARCEYDVTLWLMQDAVQLLQLNATNLSVYELLMQCLNEKRINIYVDEFSMAQRGCLKQTINNMNIGDMSLFSEQLMSTDVTPIWH